MLFDPLTLLIVPALLLMAAGGLAGWRLRSNGLAPQTEGPASDEPSMHSGAFADGLTGIGNRRAFEHSGSALLKAALAHGQDAALLVLDLDRFDGINAAHGRDAGDRLLATFARVIHDYLPPTSLVCRLGADTFAAILPAAGPARAAAIADEIRMLFAHLTIEGPKGLVRTTVSIGIAGSRGNDAGLETLLHRADLCLDRAKAGGRNRVEADGSSDDASLSRQRSGAHDSASFALAGTDRNMPKK